MKIAGYHKYAKACNLSIDNPEDALQVDNEMAGVFLIAKFLYFKKLK